MAMKIVHGLNIFVDHTLKGAPPGANRPVADPTSGPDSYFSPLWWCSEPRWKSTNRLKFSIFARKRPISYLIFLRNYKSDLQNSKTWLMLDSLRRASCSDIFKKVLQSWATVRILTPSARLYKPASELTGFTLRVRFLYKKNRFGHSQPEIIDTWCRKLTSARSSCFLQAIFYSLNNPNFLCFFAFFSLF